MLPTVVVLIAIVAVGLVGMSGLSELAFANPDFKSKRYVSEDGSGDRTISCTKDTGGCKNLKEGLGDNINKAAKEFCESDSGQRCKQSKS
jgi:hypothetical protein